MQRERERESPKCSNLVAVDLLLTHIVPTGVTLLAARCSGHSATVRTIDWSMDSSVLQSNCAAREILYWNPRTGELPQQLLGCSQRMQLSTVW